MEPTEETKPYIEALQEYWAALFACGQAFEDQGNEPMAKGIADIMEKHRHLIYKQVAPGTFEPILG